jgi:alpha-D-ribose 1-methylphosphonate 5-triphosphate synthase subunit PhnI
MGAAVSEQFEAAKSRDDPASELTAFSTDACASLGATVERFLATGRVPDELADVTADLCRQAQARGLSAEATLREIRSVLGRILQSCTISTSDRAALVAVAIDECVHAFYGPRR